MRGSRAAFAVGLLGISSPAVAVDCPIERAVYREHERSVELHFSAVRSDSSPLSHAYAVLAGAAGEAEGHILYDDEIGRPVSRILKDCPEGDVTGADLAACTVWTGIVYGIDKTAGHVDLLPPEGADAPDEILLPGFGPAFAVSSFGKALDGMPWDVFEFKECAPRG